MAVMDGARVVCLSISLLGACCMAAAEAGAQGADTAIVTRGDSLIIRIVDVDLRSAIQTLGAYLDQPVVFGTLPAARVTFETPRAVHREQVPQLLRGLLDAHLLELVRDTLAGLYRVQARSPRAGEAGARAEGVPTQQPAQDTLQLWVIRLRHARAADVAATVSALYGHASALGEIGGRPATLRDELRTGRVPPAVPGQAAAAGRLGAAQQGMTPSVEGAARRSAELSGDVVIVPDSRTNSLLVRATREDYELIQHAVDEIDIRPLQVLIEVLIVEARKDRSLAFGVDATLPSTAVPGSKNATVQGAILGIGLGDFALKMMGIGGYEIEATLRAAAARGDVAIVSRPILLAANNQHAEILVGSQRPFVQVSRSLPTDAPQRDQVIQYKDVGTQLRVRPTISADGYVMLEVTQEVNAATTEVQFDAPIISTRAVSTQLLIKDGQTVVLGGLMDRQRDHNQGGVPVLSAIPWLGGLFGRMSRRSSETELFLFLTPRIIRTDDDADEATRPLQDRARKVNP